MTDWLEAVETPEPIEEEELSEKEASVPDVDSPASNKGKQPMTEKSNESGSDAVLRWKPLYEKQWSEQDESINNMDKRIAARKRALLAGGQFCHPAPDLLPPFNEESPPEPAKKKSRKDRR